jgi:hypothetical protein
MMPAALSQFSAHRRLQGFVILLATVCLPAMPQTPHSSSPPASGLYRIAGKVVNAVTGEPVRRAAVALLAVEDSRPIASVESGNDGSFALEGLPAAKYQLTASRRGFRTAFYDEHDEFSTAIVTGAGQETTNLTFRLVPGALLHGVVTADGGDPVEGADVMLFLKPHRPGDRIVEAGSALTDDTGAYEFGNLAAGEYLLAVKAEPWYALHHPSINTHPRPANDPSAALDVAYPVTYFDSTTDETSASPIVLAGGSREEANITLHAVPALHLTLEAPRAERGEVIPVLHQTIFGAKVFTESLASPPDPRQATVEFTGIAPGHYEVEQAEPRIVELDATVNQRIDTSLGTPTVEISGTLQTSSGSSLKDEATVTLEPLDSALRQTPIQTVCLQGAFSFPKVPPGAWELWPESAGRQLPIPSIAVDGRTHVGNRLTVQDRPLSVVVTVSQAETRIEGFARMIGTTGAPSDRFSSLGWKGIAGVMVVLVPKNRSAFRSLVRRDQSDSDGSFALRDVVPGQYTLVAIPDGWALDWAQPELIGRYLPKGVAVTITENSGKLVRLSEPVPVQARY